MEFSWTVLAVVALANLGYITLMFVAQQLDMNLPPRHSTIPGTRQKFNHMQDFWTCTYGDIFALPFVLNAFAHLAVNGYISLWQWIVFNILWVVLSIGFLMMCLGKNHKPDQGYPQAGKVSVQGIVHLPHFGVSMAMALLAIWHIVAGNVKGPVLYLFIAGAVCWIASFVADNVTGNFDPLKLEPAENDCDCSKTCYTCRCRFSEARPDFGGGVCRECWAKSH